jgi:hypothetical protein
MSFLTKRVICVWAGRGYQPGPGGGVSGGVPADACPRARVPGCGTRRRQRLSDTSPNSVTLDITHVSISLLPSCRASGVLRPSGAIPRGIRLPHGTDEIAPLLGHGRSARGPLLAQPSPVSAKPLALPRDDSTGLDKRQGVVPPPPQTGKPHPKEAIGGTKPKRQT